AILLPDGSPAAGVQAVSLATEHFVRVAGTSFERPVQPVAVEGALEVTSETAERWIILHPEGWADATLSAETPELRLEPWCDLPGVAWPAPGGVVSYHRTEPPRRAGERGSVFWTGTARIGEDGAFSLRHLPKGHGSVGILREAKNGRRILRWREFVRWVEIPAAVPLELAGGATVSGRIVAPDLPAIVTLASKGPATTCHGLTDEQGRFTIPGVLPGKYWRSARHGLGSATLNIPQRVIAVGLEPLDLGEIQGAEPDVELDSRVELSDGLIARIRAEAAKHSMRKVEKIWVGELMHPSGQYGARVSFAPHPEPADATRAKQATLLLEIPGEPIRKFYPEHDSLGWGFRFDSRPFLKSRTFERSLRVFPLAGLTLFLPLEEGVDYAEALALLRAIEADSIRRLEPEIETLPDGTRRMTNWSVGDISPDDLAHVTEVRKGGQAGEITVET
ncbi:MAG: hypothetical protein N2322_06670, partial [Terrimicrobiaceae bacterium]|nr:hypothetical protein [Terrimicrobiaceae bacterium]